jgi:hypothetical protein
VQELLDSPNPNSPAQQDAYALFVYVHTYTSLHPSPSSLPFDSPSSSLLLFGECSTNRTEYKRRVKLQSTKYTQ